MCVCVWSYRGLLTLYATAVEPQGRDAVNVALDVEDAFIVPLSRLRLGQVLCQQSDGPHDASRDVDLGGGQDPRTLLEIRREKRERENKETETCQEKKDQALRGLHM